VKERVEHCLVGNHDLVVLGELTVSDFNDEAAAAAIWTAEVLTPESRALSRARSSADKGGRACRAEAGSRAAAAAASKASNDWAGRSPPEWKTAGAA